MMPAGGAKTVVLITGGGGLGIAAARLFLQNGSAVAVADVNLSKAKELQATYPALLALQCDVTEEEQVKEVVAKTVAQFGALHMALACHGSFVPALLLDLSLAQTRRTLDVHFYGSLALAKHAAKAMLANPPDEKRGNQRGLIVLTSSLCADEGNLSLLNYAAAKGALKSAVSPLCRELGPKGIRVNAVAPGTMMTDILEVLPASILDSLREHIPLGELGNPEMYAKLVEQLWENYWLHGTHIRIDGGQTSPWSEAGANRMTETALRIRSKEAATRVKPTDRDLALVERLFRERLARIDARDIDGYLETAHDDTAFYMEVAGQVIAQTKGKTPLREFLENLLKPTWADKDLHMWHLLSDVEVKAVERGEDEKVPQIQVKAGFRSLSLAKGSLEIRMEGVLESFWERPPGFERLEEWKLVEYRVIGKPATEGKAESGEKANGYPTGARL